MSITLPPLPEPSGYDDRHTEAQLRARDLEIARLVLEAAADWCKGRGHLVTADVLRSLEVRHHE